MDKIRIQNLRALKDTQEIELRPLTLLVGANSTGKSTFLRTFPLLRQGLLVNKQGPILWYGSEVDFGSFQNAVTHGNDSMSLSFFWKKIQDPWRLRAQNDICVNNVSVNICISKKKDDSYLSSLIIVFEDDQKITINFNDISMSSYKLTINDVEIEKYSMQTHLYPYSNSSLIPLIGVASEQSNIEYIQSLLNEICEENGKPISTIDIKEDNLYIGSKNYFINSINKIFNISLPETILTNPKWEKINNLLIARKMDWLLRIIDLTLHLELAQSIYIKPFRVSAERYYRIQNLSVNRLDSDGHNLAMYIQDMYKNPRTRKKFQEWTKNNFKFVIESQKKQGHISLSIKENGEYQPSNIIDKGYGYSQILPIVITLWQIHNDSKATMDTSRIIAIEQPELHLHPKLQINLIDTIIAVINHAMSIGIDIKFVIETHSQTLINRVGSLIADNDYAADNVSILLFHEKGQKNNPQIANYLSNGHLSNWPIGFFNPI